MKYETKELTGALLDAAVAKAMGLIFTIAPAVDIQQAGRQLTRDICRVDNEKSIWMVGFFPSSNWADGGPIIERERIELHINGDEWCAMVGSSQGPFGEGETPLIAAMRALVVAKLGEEVDL